MTRLEEIKERCTKVEPPPWKYRHGDDFDHWELWSEANDSATWMVHDDSGVEPSTGFLEFISHAGEDIPWLVSQLEKAIKAAEFYANNQHHHLCGTGVDVEDGTIARRFLEQMNESIRRY